jgi:hypothetical protein
MVPAKKENNHPTLEQVHELFSEWRQTKKRRDPIPDALWKAAVSLTEGHSIHEVARCLHLNHNDLKVRAQTITPMTFVELDSIPVAVDCTIEIEKPSGERMRIKGSCNVIELARVFLA